MDEKVYTLTKSDLDGIVAAAVAAVAGTPAKQGPIVNDIATANRADQKRAQEALNFNARLLREDTLPIALPVSLGDYFGDSITVSVNGNTIKIPIDGNTYYVSKPHYAQIQKKVMHNNTQLSRIKRGSGNSFFGNMTGDVGQVQM